MSSVLGVSVGSGAIRLARPRSADLKGHYALESFELLVVDTAFQQVEELAAESIGDVLHSTREINATAVTYRSEQDAEALRSALDRQRLANYELIPETTAALEFLAATGEIQGLSSIVVYDLGSSGLTVSIIDTLSREVRYAERTDEVSGGLFDALIREFQITSGRIAAPQHPAGFVELDALCRQGKEQLSFNPAAAIPADNGLALLSRENFEAMILPAVEAAARMTLDVIMRSGQTVQALVVLGGGARIPLVRSVLNHVIGLPLIVADGPETVAVRGAALLARPVPQHFGSPVIPELRFTDLREAAKAQVPKVPATIPDIGATSIPGAAAADLATSLPGATPPVVGSRPAALLERPADEQQAPGWLDEAGPLPKKRWRRESAKPVPDTALDQDAPDHPRPSQAVSNAAVPNSGVPNSGVSNAAVPGSAVPNGASPTAKPPGVGPVADRAADKSEITTVLPAQPAEPRPAVPTATAAVPRAVEPVVESGFFADVPDWLPEVDSDHSGEESDIEWAADPPRRRRLRPIGIGIAAMVGLIAVGSIGIAFAGKGGEQRSDSGRVKPATTSTIATTSTVPAPPPPPPVVTTTEAPTVPQNRRPRRPVGPPPPVAPGPNTFVIPGLPPIVVPTLPMLFPPPPR